MCAYIQLWASAYAKHQLVIIAKAPPSCRWLSASEIELVEEPTLLSGIECEDHLGHKMQLQYAGSTKEDLFFKAVLL